METSTDPDPLEATDPDPLGAIDTSRLFEYYKRKLYEILPLFLERTGIIFYVDGEWVRYTDKMMTNYQGFNTQCADILDIFDRPLEILAKRKDFIRYLAKKLQILQFLSRSFIDMTYEVDVEIGEGFSIAYCDTMVFIIKYSDDSDDSDLNCYSITHYINREIADRDMSPKDRMEFYTNGG